MRVLEGGHFFRRHGATVAREIPDLKVGGSNPSGVTHFFVLLFSTDNAENFLLRVFCLKAAG